MPASAIPRMSRITCILNSFLAACLASIKYWLLWSLDRATLIAAACGWAKPHRQADTAGFHFVIATHNTIIFASLKSFKAVSDVRVGDMYMVDARPRRSHGYHMHLLVFPPRRGEGISGEEAKRLGGVAGCNAVAKWLESRG